MRLKSVLFGIALSATLQAQSGYKLANRFPVGQGTGGWDYVTIDSAARRLYISHATQVEVMDADSGKLVGTIPDTPGVHGIAIAPGSRGFTSNGKENKVSLFDTKTLKLISKIDVGEEPDGIFYDSGSKRVFTNNHGSHDITAIDAASGKVAGTVKVGGDGEQMVQGRDGLLFVNLEDKNEVVCFDPKTLTVKKRFPIGDAKTPTGLAFDAKNNRLFIGARSQSLVVMDAADGHIVKTFPIGPGVDFGGFDPAACLIFMSNGGDGTLTVIHQKSADDYEDMGPVKTQNSAKTMAFDTKTKNIYLPAADVNVTPSADPNGRPTRTVKEGSFTVLVLSK
jgi:YVTN family beta-propeller protein